MKFMTSDTTNNKFLSVFILNNLMLYLNSMKGKTQLMISKMPGTAKARERL